MKKTIFRTVSLFGLALMLFAAGCSSGSAPAQPSAAASPQAGATASAQPKTQVELTISAAASLTDALKEIAATYEKQHATIKLNFNFGASGALQQQIEQGAPADLFFSAAAKNMKDLVDKGLIDTAQQKSLLLNELVLIVPEGGKVAASKVEDLTADSIKHVAVGEPLTVPAGTYAKEALTNAKLWDALQNKIVQGKDVRQVLTYVESGNAEAGFVYKTDALTSKQVKIAGTIDPKTYKAVEYPAGIVKATKHGKETGDFYTYLQSTEALDVFVKFGFSVAAK
ncbi:molybdate ABC transporter substrate-binding protein [Paenibacillus whitsoniae]|uniref:Molybdate ABC transporter substrate-binding protein n=1 Tax=Paenibacillus whitsoniae TaxID=2496558 RepID=A0A3S0BGK0_9BACL|nr:molybdate ABC transporter substrate-binding protein [Paenibacillus whitsoniae]RTE01983.1 molybdate ABC transporter substrate-binding protein [Paenibacillus whitsoniae]